MGRSDKLDFAFFEFSAAGMFGPVSQRSQQVNRGMTGGLQGMARVRAGPLGGHYGALRMVVRRHPKVAILTSIC